MKRKIITLFGLIIFAVVIWVGNFYWNNLRGVGPAFKEPSEDIVELIEQSERNEVGIEGDQSHDEISEVVSDPIPAENLTEFPLSIPSNFKMSIYAKDLEKPRDLLWAEGTLLASIPSQGRVVALPDRDENSDADAVVDILTGLNRPHGLALHCEETCFLYVAEEGRVLRYDYDPRGPQASNPVSLFTLPTGGRHWTRSLLIYEDKLYVVNGSSCDTCFEDDPRRSTIEVSNLDGSDLKIFATGLRNSVFMASNPSTGEIWATEMGRDLIGNDIPPEEINIIREGGDYGWPVCYGNNVHDRVFDKQEQYSCEGKIPAHIEFQAHSAPLGLAFIPDTWPASYQDDLLVVYHGSWNRNPPTGYKIALMKLDAQGNFQGIEDFISGWLTPTLESLGRPVDVEFGTNQDLYISDDKAGVVYQVQLLQ